MLTDSLDLWDSSNVVAPCLAHALKLWSQPLAYENHPEKDPITSARDHISIVKTCGKGKPRRER